MDKTAFVKYISALLLFGLNGIVANQISLNSHEIVFLRTFIGSILLITIYLFGKGTFHIRENKKDALFIVLSGVAMGTSWLFLYEAYRQIGVSLASLLYYCGPVLVIIVSPILFREKLTLPKTAGFLIVIIGIVLINGNALENGDNLRGVFSGGMSAVMYSLMIIFNKKSKQITGMENTVIQIVVSFLTVACFIGIKQRFIINIPFDNWSWILLLGIVNTGIGCYLYFSPLSKLPVQTVAVCGYLEPLSAVIFATILLNEKMEPLQIIGSICIIGGAVFCELLPYFGTATYQYSPNTVNSKSSSKVSKSL